MKKTAEKLVLHYEKVILDYEKICNTGAQYFIEKYYCDKDYQLKDVDWYWIGSEIGGVCQVNDEFWSMDSIVEALRLNPSQEQLFDHYYKSLEAYEHGKTFMNLKYYLQTYEK